MASVFILVPEEVKEGEENDELGEDGLEVQLTVPQHHLGQHVP